MQRELWLLGYLCLSGNLVKHLTRAIGMGLGLHGNFLWNGRGVWREILAGLLPFRSLIRRISKQISPSIPLLLAPFPLLVSFTLAFAFPYRFFAEHST
jgi:hypothetical protein